jgi:hypothetical protein
VHPLFTVSITNRDYWWYLTTFGFPWTQLFVCGAAVMLVCSWAIPARLLRPAAACAAVTMSVIAVFFAATTKAPTYLVPLYPFAAASVALVAALAVEYLRRVPGGMILGLSVSILMLALGARTTVHNGFLHSDAYYKESDALSREEKAIGSLLASQEPGRILYAFGDPSPPLGAIMYYSGNERPLKLAEAPSGGSSVVVRTADRDRLYRAYPGSVMDSVYAGEYLALLRVADSR